MIDLPRGKDYSTISGLLHEKLHHIPQEGDRIVIDNIKMIVEEMNGIAQIKVRIEKKTAIKKFFIEHFNWS